MNNHQPLKITFRMAGRFIPPDASQALHLDGLLASMHVQAQLRGMDADNASQAHIRSLQAGMDQFLSTESRDGMEVFKASMIHVPKRHVGQAVMTRKTDTDRICLANNTRNASQEYEVPYKNKRKIDLNSGQYRNWLYYLPVDEITGDAVAWCVGDRARITELLFNVRFLGRKGSIGFGEVREVVVEADPRAAELWQVRHLPWPKDDYQPVTGGFQAPYWDRSLHTKVWVPTL